MRKCNIFIIILFLSLNVSYATQVTNQDREACKTAVGAMLFFKLKTHISLMDSKRRDAEIKVAGDRFVDTGWMTHIKKSDCVEIGASMESEKANIQSKLQFCATTQSAEQMRALVTADANESHANESPAAFINNKIDSFAQGDCHQTQAGTREAANILITKTNMRECCEVALDSLKKMVQQFGNSNCSGSSTSTTATPTPLPADTCEIAETDGLCKNSTVRNTPPSTPPLTNTPDQMSDFERLKANCLQFGANGQCIRTRSGGGALAR